MSNERKMYNSQLAVMRKGAIANNYTFQGKKNVIKAIKTSGITHHVSVLASQQSNLHPVYQKKPWQEARANLYTVKKCFSFINFRGVALHLLIVLERLFNRSSKRKAQLSVLRQISQSYGSETTEHRYHRILKFQFCVRH